MDWKPYLLDVDWTHFSVGTRVLDVGCGAGDQLRELIERRCIAIGVDVRFLPNTGFVCAAAEALPFRDETFDGVVCKVTLPYTDQRRALAEIARVLRGAGTCRLSCHGLGYYVRYLVYGRFRERIYAARTIVNTWLYWLTNRRIVGDTLYQSPRHLPVDAVSRYLGLPVFIYTTLNRRDRSQSRDTLTPAAITVPHNS